MSRPLEDGRSGACDPTIPTEVRPAAADVRPGRGDQPRHECPPRREARARRRAARRAEALLGLVAALAADAPEITAAAAAIVAGRAAVGLGVTLGRRLQPRRALGIGAIVAGGIALHRRVVELEGAIALVVAGIATATVLGWLAPDAGLALAVLAFAPYVALAALGPAARATLPIRRPWRRWLAATMVEEEAELAAAVRPAPGTAVDALVALAAVVVLVSLVMEATATTLGAQAGVPDIVVGGLVLAAVSSLPNLVAGVHLASHGRGQATLSTAFNSNAVNVLLGLLLPASLAA